MEIVEAPIELYEACYHIMVISQNCELTTTSDGQLGLIESTLRSEVRDRTIEAWITWVATRLCRRRLDLEGRTIENTDNKMV